MRRITAAMLSVLLIGGLVPEGVMNAAGTDAGKPNLVNGRIEGDRTIVLTFDKLLTDLDSSEDPTGGSSDYETENVSTGYITTSIPSSENRLISAEAQGTELRMTFNSSISNLNLIDLTVYAGAVHLVDDVSSYSDEIRDYRVRTEQGKLALKQEIDAQGTGFSLEGIMAYLKTLPENTNIVGLPNINGADIRFLLSLMDFGLVDRSGLVVALEKADELLEKTKTTAGLAEKHTAFENAVAGYRELLGTGATPMQRQLDEASLALDNARFAFELASLNYRTPAGPEAIEPVPGTLLASLETVPLAKDSEAEIQLFTEADRLALLDSTSGQRAAVRVKLPSNTDNGFNNYRIGDRVGVMVGEGAASFYFQPQLVGADIARLNNSNPNDNWITFDITPYFTGVIGGSEVPNYTDLADTDVVSIKTGNVEPYVIRVDVAPTPKFVIPAETEGTTPTYTSELAAAVGDEVTVQVNEGCSVGAPTEGSCIDLYAISQAEDTPSGDGLVDYLRGLEPVSSLDASPNQSMSLSFWTGELAAGGYSVYAVDFRHQVSAPIKLTLSGESVPVVHNDAELAERLSASEPPAMVKAENIGGYTGQLQLQQDESGGYYYRSGVGKAFVADAKGLTLALQDENLSLIYLADDIRLDTAYTFPSHSSELTLSAGVERVIQARGFEGNYENLFEDDKVSIVDTASVSTAITAAEAYLVATYTIDGVDGSEPRSALSSLIEQAKLLVSELTTQAAVTQAAETLSAELSSYKQYIIGVRPMAMPEQVTPTPDTILATLASEEDLLILTGNVIERIQNGEEQAVVSVKLPSNTGAPGDYRAGDRVVAAISEWVREYTLTEADVERLGNDDVSDNTVEVDISGFFHSWMAEGLMDGDYLQLSAYTVNGSNEGLSSDWTLGPELKVSIVDTANLSTTITAAEAYLVATYTIDGVDGSEPRTALTSLIEQAMLLVSEPTTQEAVSQAAEGLNAELSSYKQYIIGVRPMAMPVQVTPAPDTVLATLAAEEDLLILTGNAIERIQNGEEQAVVSVKLPSNTGAPTDYRAGDRVVAAISEWEMEYTLTEADIERFGNDDESDNTVEVDIGGFFLLPGGLYNGMNLQLSAYTVNGSNEEMKSDGQLGPELKVSIVDTTSLGTAITAAQAYLQVTEAIDGAGSEPRSTLTSLVQQAELLLSETTTQEAINQATEEVNAELLSYKQYIIGVRPMAMPEQVTPAPDTILATLASEDDMLLLTGGVIERIQNGEEQAVVSVKLPSNTGTPTDYWAGDRVVAAISEWEMEYTLTEADIERLGNDDESDNTVEVDIGGFFLLPGGLYNGMNLQLSAYTVNGSNEAMKSNRELGPELKVSIVDTTSLSTAITTVEAYLVATYTIDGVDGSEPRTALTSLIGQAKLLVSEPTTQEAVNQATEGLSVELSSYKQYIITVRPMAMPEQVAPAPDTFLATLASEDDLLILTGDVIEQIQHGEEQAVVSVKLPSNTGAPTDYRAGDRVVAAISEWEREYTLTEADIERLGNDDGTDNTIDVDISGFFQNSRFMDGDYLQLSAYTMNGLNEESKSDRKLGTELKVEFAFEVTVSPQVVEWGEEVTVGVSTGCGFEAVEGTCAELYVLSSYEEVPSGEAELLSYLEQKNASATLDGSTGPWTTLSTEQLEPGAYRVYAVSASDEVSEPASFEVVENVISSDLEISYALKREGPSESIYVREINGYSGQLTLQGEWPVSYYYVSPDGTAFVATANGLAVAGQNEAVKRIYVAADLATDSALALPSTELTASVERYITAPGFTGVIPATVGDMITLVDRSALGVEAYNFISTNPEDSLVVNINVGETPLAEGVTAAEIYERMKQAFRNGVSGVAGSDLSFLEIGDESTYALRVMNENAEGLTAYFDRNLYFEMPYSTHAVAYIMIEASSAYLDGAFYEADDDTLTLVGGNLMALSGGDSELDITSQLVWDRMWFAFDNMMEGYVQQEFDPSHIVSTRVIDDTTLQIRFESGYFTGLQAYNLPELDNWNERTLIAIESGFLRDAYHQNIRGDDGLMQEDLVDDSYRVPRDAVSLELTGEGSITDENGTYVNAGERVFIVGDAFSRELAEGTNTNGVHFEVRLAKNTGSYQDYRVGDTIVVHLSDQYEYMAGDIPEGTGWVEEFPGQYSYTLTESDIAELENWEGEGNDTIYLELDASGFYGREDLADGVFQPYTYTRVADTVDEVTEDVVLNQWMVVDRTAPEVSAYADGGIYATLNERSDLFIVPADAEISGISDLYRVYSPVVMSQSAGESIAIDGSALSSGYYVAYAVDTAGNLSAPSSSFYVYNELPLPEGLAVEQKAHYESSGTDLIHELEADGRLVISFNQGVSDIVLERIAAALSEASSKPLTVSSDGSDVYISVNTSAISEGESTTAVFSYDVYAALDEEGIAEQELLLDVVLYGNIVDFNLPDGDEINIAFSEPITQSTDEIEATVRVGQDGAWTAVPVTYLVKQEDGTYTIIVDRTGLMEVQVTAIEVTFSTMLTDLNERSIANQVVTWLLTL
ncbi:hypothetical protein FHS18_005962 [Paenibacillus phyllosphaerae]|uniref:Uncharacterized protein n=1 Tax=Paenibacillus phyllosphaerae TaxID=274593 RepID=A0A7W5FRA6_9BACL|nr:hypothetical protein [Paenibacillus phyllosphaerae]MBB3113849.1 hypothetical protein [Paenibacillus phyllosphaerae]